MSSHLSKTEYEIMEYFWRMGDKYTFGKLMKYFNENLDKNWKKQTLNTFLSRLIEKGLLKKEKEDSDYSFWNLDEDRIRDVMDLNYMGTLLPIQVFTKDMVEKRSGSIINIASVTSILPLTKVIAYGNAKSAILNLTQWLAVHFGESGIRCNAIAPGFYAAEQNHDLLFNADGSYTDRARKIIAGTPMGRFGNPEELIGAALFLASDETASFVNGIVLPVDGGYSAYSGV